MTRLSVYFFGVGMALLLAACGGGGGSAGTVSFGSGTASAPSTTASAAATLSVSLSSTTVTSAAPVTVSAVVKDASGAAVSGQVVSFTTTLGLGTFSAKSALTDSTGKATVSLAPGSTTAGGADTVVATATVGTTSLTASVGFQTTATASSAAMTVGLSTTTVTSGSPATVSAVIKDATGAGVAGQVVTFSTTLGLGSFSATTALTDGTGTATVSLAPTSSTTRGADTVVATASVASTVISAQVSFQLSATTVTIASFKSDVTSLGAYGQTTLTVVLAGTTAASPVTVAVSSGCVAQSPTKATLTPSTVTTTTGTASFTYRDQGCGATAVTDTLQASITGTASVAPLSIALTSPTVSSVTFVSASSPTIYLKGSGFNETSEITFQVRDQAGNGLPNQSVLLQPTTLTGGLTLDGGSASVTKVSDSNGNVLVRVNSGTVPTPVRIRASLTSNATVQTVSSNLSISVGLPSQLNFSLSQTTTNIEGGELDGTQNSYNIIASDRLGNPVPDNTAINFVTEGGGQVASSAFTATNASGLSNASAKFQSSEPRPTDGRITVLAYALGEESFLDANNNNVYDLGEDFQDLGNLYIDRLFDGFYDSSTDQGISLSINNTSACHTAASPLLAINQFTPSVAGTCDGLWGTAYVRRAIETILSTSHARPLWNLPPGNLYDNTTQACTDGAVTLITGYKSNGSGAITGSYHEFGAGGLFDVPITGVVSFVAADTNSVRLNPMPAGTVISATATTGLTVTVNGSPVANASEATFAGIGYTFDTKTRSGTISVTFTAPSGAGTVVGLFISQDAPTGLVRCTN